MKGLGYHEGYHQSSTEVASRLDDLPVVEWVRNNIFSGKHADLS
jgi:hypothetical protein